MIKVIMMMKRKSGMTKDEFSRYWYERHASLLKTVVPEDVLSLWKSYTQNHALELPGRGEPPFDGVVEIGFDNLESFQKWSQWYFSDDAKALREDEDKFMDKSKRISVVAEERVMSQ